MTEVSAEQAATAIRKARGALSRYRTMALVTGVMLLILVVEMVIKYAIGQFVDVDGVMTYLRWIPIVHGWVYVVYLVTVLHLWSVMRWGWGRLTTMVLSGVVPLMSFVVERRVHADGEAKLAGLAERYEVAGA
ncbi:DUF3817 domain-containing protein [Xylanimonas oleitrophica]|uniref:DUF3817 domain-containing protein n=1 Tax=Xylanimonas oleitrophica TaxID=2607479 RepID=A0A2W5WUH2_9MICO|nr:DUF3817 domain-containing protein [Xylanimonas oleitrophica]PZR54927.1 DUF3817 domain-containing protein [Xylanimonas oleitrophica]